MTNEAITIVLPLPSARLSPNRPVMTRGGRIAKAVETKKYRANAKAVAEAVGLESGPWAKARASEVFFWPDKRRRDVRNAEARMKPAFDGIVDAGVLADDSADHLTHLPTEFEVDRQNPRVEIRIERVS